MTVVRVAVLRCPRCNGELEGGDGDVVFGCWPCRLAWVFEESGWRSYPVAVWRAGVSPEADGLWVPLWRFACAVQVAGGTPAHEQEAARLRSVWVPAFFAYRAEVLGNPGIDLTGLQPDAADDEGTPPWRGCERSAVSAARHARTYVAWLVDRRADITGCDVEVQVSDPHLWWVATERDERERAVRCPAARTTYPLALFPAHLVVDATS